MKATLTPLTLAAIVGYGLCCHTVLTLVIVVGIAVLFVALMCLFNTDCRN